MIKAVIFDMDGVIVDTILVHNIAEQKVLSDAGVKLTLEEVRSYAGPPAEVWFREVLNKNNKSTDADELVDKKHEIMYGMLQKEIPIMPGFPKLFNSLKKNRIRVALASGSQRRFVDFILSKLGVEFDAVVTYEDVPNSKPHPDIFLAASKKLKVNPRNCLVIEDASYGVKAAKRAGMMCIGLINKNSGEQNLSEADLIIHSLNELTLERIQELFKK